MKKLKLFILIGIIVLGLLILTGCTNESVAENKRFVYVSDEGTFDIYYDSKTKIMYAVSDGVYNQGTVTLLVNAEGKPLLWEE